MDKYQVAIIGGGPGGYVTAIRLEQFGIKCVVFEKDRLGGVCLNRGCIPTKSLVKVADLYHEINSAEEFGIEIDNAILNYSNVKLRKNKVVEKLVSGVEFIFKKRKITVIKEVISQIKKSEKGFLIETSEHTLLFDYVIVATGSIPKELPSLKIDGKDVLSSTEILDLEELPENLLIVGGGVIGCEFASIYSQFGVKVQIVEFLPKLVFNEDGEISKRLLMYLKKSGIKIHLKTAVESYKKNEDKLIVNLSNGEKLETDKILLSVGRAPVSNIEFIGYPELAKERGFIKIDDQFRTNIKNVFAIGDVTGKLMLAHTASKQGQIVADIIKKDIDKKGEAEIKLVYENIPRCTFTNPEIGSVGLTTSQAKERYKEIEIGKFPFSANGKALGLGSTLGFVKAIANKKDGRILGFHIIGPQATELIAQCAVLIGTKATINDVKNIVFAHPTLSEAVMEAVEDLEKLAIHKL